MKDCAGTWETLDTGVADQTPGGIHNIRLGIKGVGEAHSSCEAG
jgi:hypothetical protein